jgi:hypothetical protein
MKRTRNYARRQATRRPGPPKRHAFSGLRESQILANRTPRLKRETFRTSRDMDFLSERELTAQIGHDRTEWGLVTIKEAIDNALDACEENGIPLEIAVTADAAGIGVADNGPGIPDSTIQAVLDFSVRVSSREAYVSPTRSQQGNALKTLAAMPYVVDPQHGRLIIQSCGLRRTIRCGMDPVTRTRLSVHTEQHQPRVQCDNRAETRVAPRAADRRGTRRGRRYRVRPTRVIESGDGPRIPL